MGHAGCPGPVSAFLYEFHMPLFFITAGYFFSLKYLDDEASFIKKRIKGLYLPFLKWSAFFLIIHNWMFDLGILNELYGNADGGVTHPYSWHQTQQNLWTMVTAMGGYDQFLNGAFWFFRGLFVASILYLIMFKALDITANRIGKKSWRNIVIPVLVCALALCLGAWKTGEGLRVINMIQGGYREIMGTFFFGCGFIFRQLQSWYKANLMQTAVFAAVTLVFSRYASSGMAWNSTFEQFLKLPVPAVCGFLMTYNISTWLNRHEGWAKRFLVFCGDNTLSVLVFHIISFKVISLLKIWYYGLDIKQIGCHMVIHEHASTDCFWILYTIAGVGIPLAWTYYARIISSYTRSLMR